MAQQSNLKNEKHYSPRLTNFLLGTSIAILIATVLIRYLTPSESVLAFEKWVLESMRIELSFQTCVLVLMGIGVFLFLLVAFDQPE